MNKYLPELLKEARNYIANGWIKQKYAGDRDGNGTDTYDDNAVCFCALGAIERAANKLYESFPEDLITQIISSPIYLEEEAVKLIDAEIPQDQRVSARSASRRVILWNDHIDRTQEDVLKVFDAAIGRINL